MDGAGSPDSRAPSRSSSKWKPMQKLRPMVKACVEKARAGCMRAPDASTPSHQQEEVQPLPAVAGSGSEQQRQQQQQQQEGSRFRMPSMFRPAIPKGQQDKKGLQPTPDTQPLQFSPVAMEQHPAGGDLIAAVRAPAGVAQQAPSLSRTQLADGATTDVIHPAAQVLTIKSCMCSFADCLLCCY